MPTPPFPEVELITYPLNKRAELIYWTIIFLIGAILATLPLITVDISIRSPGLIRPESERTIIRSVVPGLIEKLYGKEGAFVEKDSLILVLKDPITLTRLLNLDVELAQKIKLLSDLEILTGVTNVGLLQHVRLSTPLYSRQLSRYLFHLKDQGASITKVRKELRSDSLLYTDKVISGNEYFNKDIESQKLVAAFEAFQEDQLSTWQQQQLQIKSEVLQLQAQRHQLLEEKKRYEIRAPVSGTLQGLNSKYAGSFLQAGEPFCELSPETALIAECFVSTQDIGFLKQDQPVNFQVDAFDYNYFGIIKGRIISIDNDFSVLENIPVYKVRCRLEQNTIPLRNGYNGHLKKGLKLQARFIIARRTIAELLFDKIDDWLNPVAF
ncbi:MAG: HlyD family efflux transporter periplasmic adaptor subunit [Chitinophagaceae bacterium]|nr:MAG: HlyD family efflux transporter periplasmic adaptor subunit [Chitinophagaceae bacterium]